VYVIRTGFHAVKINQFPNLKHSADQCLPAAKMKKTGCSLIPAAGLNESQSLGIFNKD